MTTAATLALTSIAFVGAPAASASTSATIPRHGAARITVPGPLRQGLLALIGLDWNPITGRFGTGWREAVAASTMETYHQTIRDDSYDYTFNIGYRQDPNVHLYEDNFDDDTAWWGLAWLQGYEITRIPYYLHNAEAIANYIHKDWATACGGGVWWQRSPHHDTGAIANELFIELTAWLHNTIVANHGTDKGPQSYLAWATYTWNWFARSGMISNGWSAFHGKLTYIPPYLVSNSLPHGAPRSECTDSISRNLYTYNQGVILAGLAQLYKATSNSFYLTEAEHIANAVLNPKSRFTVMVSNKRMTTSFVVKGVLTEPTCQPTEHCGGGDEGEFKGIFVRDLRTLDNVIASAPAKYNKCTAEYSNKTYSQCTAMYNEFFTTQARSIERQDSSVCYSFLIPFRDCFGMFWQGPRNRVAIGVTQVSALEALVASVNLPKPTHHSSA